MKAFCNQYKLKSLNKEPTCFKNVNKPSCIDLFLTNNSKCFEDCLTLETGLYARRKFVLCFWDCQKEKIGKLITNLNMRKAAQSNEIPTKLVKEFGYLFPKYIATSINICITGGTL